MSNAKEKKLIFAPDNHLFHVTSTIKQMVFILCGFNLLVALIEAHFWHFTEPTTLGFKIWPVLITFVALCGPGVFLPIKQIRNLVLPVEVQLLLSLICPIALLMAASPAFYDNAPARTIILAIGTFILPFIVFWCWSPCQKGLTGEVFLAVFITMCIRFTANSVNIFYESWGAPAAFFAIHFLSSALHYIAYRNVCYAANNKELCDDDVEKASVVDKTVDMTIKDDTIITPPPTDAIQSATELKENEDVTVSPMVAIPVLLLLIPGLVSSVMLFIQYFTSPTLFVRWSGYAAGPLRVLILMISLINAAVCACCFNQAPVLKRKRNADVSCLENNAPLIFLTVNCSAILLIGSLLFIFAVNSFAMFGASSICLVLPFTFTRILDSFLLLQHHVSRTHPSIPGISLLIGGILFFGLHLFIISFTVSTLVSFLIARMDVILLTQILLVCMSFVTGEVLISRKALTNPYESTHSDRVFNTQCATRCAFIAIIVFVTGLITASVTTVHTCEHMNQIKPNTYYDATANSSDPNTFRVMSWNVLLGHTMSGRDNSACVSRAIQHYGPKLVAFQESDPLPAFWGGKDFMGSCQYQLSEYGYKTQQGVLPMKSTLGVGVLSKFELIKHRASLLPVETPNQVPHYSYTKSSYKVPNSTQRLYVITAHAVFKNWTVGNLSSLSTSHIQLLAKEANDGPQANDPVIVIGDLNLNPTEAQLDFLWNDANLSCALNINRTFLTQSTTFGNHVNIDHIFYRNLKLLAPGEILTEVGPISDHSPVIADFAFLPDSSS